MAACSGQWSPCTPARLGWAESGMSPAHCPSAETPAASLSQGIHNRAVLGTDPGAYSVLSTRRGSRGEGTSQARGLGTRNADPLGSESCSATLSLKVVQQHSPRLTKGRRYTARRFLGHREPDCFNHLAVCCGHSLFQTILLSPVRSWIVFSIPWSLLLRVTPSFRPALLPCGQGNLLHTTWTVPGIQQRKTQGAPPTLTSCAGERSADGRQARSSFLVCSSHLLPSHFTHSHLPPSTYILSHSSLALLDFSISISSCPCHL